MRRWLGILLAVLALATVLPASATVTTTTNSVVAIGNGVTTVFNFPFVGVTASDITVIYTDASGNTTTLTPTQYTLVLNAASSGQIWGIGGTVTYPLSGSPIATGTTLTITRALPLTQTVSSAQGQLFPQSVEQGMDLLAMQNQQTSSAVSRAIQTDTNDTCASLGKLPAASQRADQLLGFDSTGCNPVVSQPSAAPVSAAMQPVVNAATISAALTLMGISPTNYVQPCMEADWPGIAAGVPSGWHLEDGSAVSRTTYTSLLACLAPVVPCTITSGSTTITGISSTVGWGTGWIIESPGSSALGTGITISAVGGSSVTVSGGTPSSNATSCQVFPYGTAQDGTFALPNAAGVTYAGIDTANTNLNSTYFLANPAYLNALGGNQSYTFAQANLPNVNFANSNILMGNGFTGTFSGSASLCNLAASACSGGSTPQLAYTSTGSDGGGQTIVPNPAPSAEGISASGGSGTPMTLIQPTRIRNKIIFTGVP